jgi:hypothetical protein
MINHLAHQSVLVCYEGFGDGAHVTVQAPDGEPVIITFDLDDLRHFAAIARVAEAMNPADSQEDRMAITPRGIEFLRKSLAVAE